MAFRRRRRFRARKFRVRRRVGVRRFRVRRPTTRRYASRYRRRSSFRMQSRKRKWAPNKKSSKRSMGLVTWKFPSSRPNKLYKRFQFALRNGFSANVYGVQGSTSGTNGPQKLIGFDLNSLFRPCYAAASGFGPVANTTMVTLPVRGFRNWMDDVKYTGYQGGSGKYRMFSTRGMAVSVRARGQAPPSDVVQMNYVWATNTNAIVLAGNQTVSCRLAFQETSLRGSVLQDADGEFETGFSGSEGFRNKYMWIDSKSNSWKRKRIYMKKQKNAANMFRGGITDIKHFILAPGYDGGGTRQSWHFGNTHWMPAMTSYTQRSGQYGNEWNQYEEMLDIWVIVDRDYNYYYPVFLALEFLVTYYCIIAYPFDETAAAYAPDPTALADIEEIKPPVVLSGAFDMSAPLPVKPRAAAAQDSLVQMGDTVFPVSVVEKAIANGKNIDDLMAGEDPEPEVEVKTN